MTDHEVVSRAEWQAVILDRVAKGRDEDGAFQTWIRRHDEYAR